MHIRRAEALAELVRGAVEVERTTTGLRPHRLPAWARAQAADAQLAMAEAQPGGVRVSFTTAATRVELEALATRFGYRGAPRRPLGVVDLVVDGAVLDGASLPSATVVTIDMATGARSAEPADPSRVVFGDLPAGDKRVDLWLPHNESLELVALHTDAPAEPVTARGPVWLHHGSSISQGSNATRPTGTWPAVAAREAGVELVNLGLGGSALLDPFTARTLRDQPADAISVKLGINVVNADLMRLRAFGPAVHGFLDTIRDGHPDTPLLVVTPVLCPIHETTPGPGAFDTAALAEGRMRFRATGDPAEVAAGRLTLTVIREALTRVVTARQAQDPHLYLLDGLELYGEADAATHPLPDALHPDAATHHLMGTRFAARALLPGARIPLLPGTSA